MSGTSKLYAEIDRQYADKVATMTEEEKVRDKRRILPLLAS